MVALGNALSRGLFALARDRLLPAPLAMRSRHDTPLGGIVALTVAGLLTIGIGILSGNPFKLFEVVAIQDVVLATPIIFLLAAGAIRLFAARRAELLIRLPIILAGAAVPALALYATLSPFPTGPARWGLGLVVSVLAVTVGWGCWLFSTRAPAVAQAAAYARTPASAGPSSEPGG